MKRFTLLAVTLFYGLFVFAQQEYEWDAYGVAFTLPDDFRETSSNSETFEAEGEGMAFSITVFEDGDLDEEDIVDFTLSIAEEINMDVADEADLVDVNGYVGAYILGMKDGVAFYLLGMIDPESETNFYALFAFDDEDDVADEDAVGILLSIRPI